MSLIGIDEVHDDEIPEAKICRMGSLENNVHEAG